MSRQLTQFAIALTLSLGLAIATVSAVVAEVFFNGRSELTLALVTGLVAANGQAIAFLFRTNNTIRSVDHGEPHIQRKES